MERFLKEGHKLRPKAEQPKAKPVGRPRKEKEKQVLQEEDEEEAKRKAQAIPKPKGRPKKEPREMPPECEEALRPVKSMRASTVRRGEFEEKISKMSCELQALRAQVARMKAGEAGDEEEEQKGAPEEKEEEIQELRAKLRKTGSTSSENLWGEYGALGGEAPQEAAKLLGHLGKEAGSQQGPEGSKASEAGRKAMQSEEVRQRCREAGWQGKEAGKKGGVFGHCGGRPRKGQSREEEPELPSAVGKGLGQGKCSQKTWGQKLKAAEFIEEKLKEAGYKDDEGARPTEEHWAQIRRHFPTGVKSRDLRRMYEQKAILVKAIQHSGLGRAGGMFRRKLTAKQKSSAQHGAGVRLIARHFDESADRTKGPGKRSLLAPVYDLVHEQFLKWRKAGQYVDLRDLGAEFSFQADEIRKKLEAERERWMFTQAGSEAFGGDSPKT